ncbi:MAG: YceH family protein [Halofilum sp. (in: g-proteobacteria)]|nr:YceH family protein [Halofilum sp. (in: g-proteobacteria)]
MQWNLSPEELRVLGSLVEKAATTPEQYPLSVNALRNACNQKSSRDPVMELDESSVREAISSLTRRGLVKMGSGYGGRVSKFAHRFGEAASGLELGDDQVAVLCVLFLRGPQTPGELRARTQRLHEFADTAAVEAVLDGLEQHAEGPLVRRLERQPGKREHRYVHCFGEQVEESEVEPAAVAPASPSAPAPDGSDLEARVTALEDQLRDLRERLDRLTGVGDDS